MSIKVENLRKEFGSQVAVNNISFDIPSGNIVGFLGPNGAGKSTTMKMLTTYLLPTAGKAYVGGIDVVKEPLAVRKKIGYLPESNPLYFDMYVREYLAFVADIHQLGKRQQSRIDDMIQLTGLQKEIHKKIGKLSKGYKQRVGLAQAMIHDPEVLILDEPTSGLDPNQLIEIRDLIVAIGKEKTVLLSTHIMQEVEAMCNTVIIIKNGNIVANDAIEHIRVNENKAVDTLYLQLAAPLFGSAWPEFKHLLATVQIDERTFEFKTNQVTELRKEIMTWALANNMDIEQLQVSKDSLEDTFRKLTNS